MAFTMKQGDTLPNLPFQFFEPDGETPLDISAAQVIQIVIRKAGGGDLLFKKPTTITNPLEGRGFYDWDQGDTDEFGAFDYEFEITWSTGDIQTVPVETYLSLVIVDDIG